MPGSTPSTPGARRGADRARGRGARADTDAVVPVGRGRAWRAGEPDHAVEDAGAVGADAQKKSFQAAERQRADVAQARHAWAAGQSRFDVRRVVFLDETWASTNMSPSRGRSPRGRRCPGQVPHGHWKTTTFVCALRSEGLFAPLVLDGPINGQAFRTWVEQALAPTQGAGDIVVMDNLGSHKVAGVREAIQARGAELCYLPPYSPDYNPIEQVFAKLKPLLRKAAARTVDALWSAIGTLLERFPAAECERYIRHYGYGQSG
nr:IS630 family transposase [Azotobacter salinestris]